MKRSTLAEQERYRPLPTHAPIPEPLRGDVVATDRAPFPAGTDCLAAVLESVKRNSAALVVGRAPGRKPVLIAAQGQRGLVLCDLTAVPEWTRRLTPAHAVTLARELRIHDGWSVIARKLAPRLERTLTQVIKLFRIRWDKAAVSVRVAELQEIHGRWAAYNPDAERWHRVPAKTLHAVKLLASYLGDDDANMRF